MKDIKDELLKEECKYEKFTFKDLLALTIAGIQVVLPFVLILVACLTLVLIIMTKFWIK
ncbi:hypothetical protein [Haloimpatiens lingqiaonensis]|uniref:hypothetical protein n=1 Tax=Haloimpatiens lingqiaonensis TaxID=1380675 RepID=UPI001485653D|nr:hypothetical protein [Haloimpatiens lingqiaonensis]